MNTNESVLVLSELSGIERQRVNLYDTNNRKVLSELSGIESFAFFNSLDNPFKFYLN